MYEANANSASNRGLRSDLPSYFRSESHTMGVHKFLTHSRLHELIRCLLPRDEEGEPPALKLYPVYMARGKVPDRLAKSAMTVDWHQDAEYTYYWYSALNSCAARPRRASLSTRASAKRGRIVSRCATGRASKSMSTLLPW